MGFLESIGFRKKSATPVEGEPAVAASVVESESIEPLPSEQRLAFLAKQITATPFVANANFVTL